MRRAGWRASSSCSRASAERAANGRPLLRAASPPRSVRHVDQHAGARAHVLLEQPRHGAAGQHVIEGRVVQHAGAARSSIPAAARSASATLRSRNTPLRKRLPASCVERAHDDAQRCRCSSLPGSQAGGGMSATDRYFHTATTSLLVKAEAGAQARRVEAIDLTHVVPQALSRPDPASRAAAAARRARSRPRRAAPHPAGRARSRAGSRARGMARIPGGRRP